VIVHQIRCKIAKRRRRRKLDYHHHCHHNYIRSYLRQLRSNIFRQRERDSMFLTAHQHKNRPFSAVRGKNQMG